MESSGSAGAVSSAGGNSTEPDQRLLARKSQQFAVPGHVQVRPASAHGGGQGRPAMSGRAAVIGEGQFDRPPCRSARQLNGNRNRLGSPNRVVKVDGRNGLIRATAHKLSKPARNSRDHLIDLLGLSPDSGLNSSTM